MKHIRWIVMGILLLGVLAFVLKASAQTPQHKEKPAATAAAPETLETLKLNEVENLKLQNLQQQRTILLQQQQLLQKQFNETTTALQQLSVTAKAEFEQVAKDHKLKDVEFDTNTFTLVPAKKEPVQNATPSSNK